MFDQDLGPRTTFEEDVKLLGIANLFEDGSAVAAAAVKPGTNQPGVSAPAAQTQAQKPAKPAAKPAKAQEAEDEDEDEIVGEEDEGEEDEGEEDADSDEDEGEEDEDEEDDSAEEDVDPDFEATVNEDEKLVAAIDVLGAFYDKLDEDEGESFDSDTLAAVIEAYEYVADSFGLLDEMRRFRIKGGKKTRITRGARKKAMKGHKGGVERMKYTASGKKVRKSSDEIRAQKRAARKLAMGAASRKGGAMHRARSMRKSKRLASDETHEGTPLSELVQNLGALKEAVQGKVDYRKSAEELKEGFNSIGETASTWMESIATEVKQAKTEEQDFDPENDPRVQMGRHLDGIAESAALIIQALDAGEADLQEAATDLESLAADLNDAAEVMKTIE